MGFLEDLARARATGTGKYFTPGRYELVLTDLRVKRERSGRMFIAEHKILRSEATGELDRQGKPYIPPAAGSSVTFIVNLDNRNADGSQYSNVKRYLLHLLGGDEDATSDADFIALCKGLGIGEGANPTEEAEIRAAEKAQPMRGKFINTECWNKAQKKDPTKDYTNHKWQHVPQSAESVSAERAKLDAPVTA